MSDKELQLIRMRIEILKLMADDYTWHCHVPKDVKAQLEETLGRINAELKPAPKEGKDE